MNNNTNKNKIKLFIISHIINQSINIKFNYIKLIPNFFLLNINKTKTKYTKHIINKKDFINLYKYPINFNKYVRLNTIKENYIIKIEKIKKIKKINSFFKQKLNLSEKKLKKTMNITNRVDNNLVTKSKVSENLKYQIIFNNILFNLFKKKITIINFNYFYKTKIKKFQFIIKKILNKHHFLKKTIFTYKIIKILLASVIYKDSSILVLIIKGMFEAIHYSKHRIYFSFCAYLIKAFLSNSLKKLNVFGVKLEFHGKLGVGGNSKKRSVYYHIGRCSNSSKIFKIDSSQSYFKTATGVVGFTYTIFY